MPSSDLLCASFRQPDNLQQILFKGELSLPHSTTDCFIISLIQYQQARVAAVFPVSANKPDSLIFISLSPYLSDFCLSVSICLSFGSDLDGKEQHCLLGLIKPKQKANISRGFGNEWKTSEINSDGLKSILNMFTY